MKKLLVAFVAVVAVSFASCVNGNTEANVKDTIDSIVNEVEEVVDSVLADTAIVDSIAE
jgi:hypothetical protein